MPTFRDRARLVALAAGAVGLPASPARAYIGTSPLPAGLAESDVVLFEDFEGARTVFDLAIARSTSAVKAGVGTVGSRGLEMGAALAALFSYRLPLGAAYDVLYARYMFKLGNPASSCWNSGQQYKNMGFEGGTEECKGALYTSNGTDCFTVRSNFNYPKLGLRVESAPYPGLFDFMDTSGTNAGDGNWQCIEFRAQLNTPGAKDGDVRLWVNGKESVKAGLQFRTAASLRIDKWWITYWANDQFCGPLYLDDLVISRRPIGCPGGAPPSPPMMSLHPPDGGAGTGGAGQGGTAGAAGSGGSMTGSMTGGTGGAAGGAGGTGGAGTGAGGTTGGTGVAAGTGGGAPPVQPAVKQESGSCHYAGGSAAWRSRAQSACAAFALCAWLVRRRHGRTRGDRRV